jgi:hypothetical protein
MTAMSFTCGLTLSRFAFKNSCITPGTVNGLERGVERTRGYVDCHGTVTDGSSSMTGRDDTRFESTGIISQRKRRRYLSMRGVLPL